MQQMNISSDSKTLSYSLMFYIRYKVLPACMVFKYYLILYIYIYIYIYIEIVKKQLK